MFTTIANLDLTTTQPVVFGAAVDENNTQIESLLPGAEIDAAYKAVTVLPTYGKHAFSQLYVLGLGARSELTVTKLRQLFGRFAQMIKGDFTIELDHFVTSTITLREVAVIFAETMIIARYEFKKHGNFTAKFSQLSGHVVASENVQLELAQGEALGQAINHARTLSNEPGNKMTPRDLAKYAKKLADKYGMEHHILKTSDLLNMQANALLAVNRGSDEPARMIVLKYQGLETWENPTALVGKGLTFDAGGYSLKISGSMQGMKHDMTGAANVLGAIEAIAHMGVKANVLVVIPATENLINGQALKVDDVIGSLAGKTIEVNNTDAEGRLILADGIEYARQLGATRIIDMATLTGACVVALGSAMTGAFSNNDQFMSSLAQAAKQADEKVWRLPLDEAYTEQVRSSKVADLINSPSREGGASIAAAFLQEFAVDTPWIHLDIAGTGDTKSASDLGPAGATGVMVRTLTQLFLNEEV
ncbi:MAG: leucyl aminopeptidase [Culicoidibacterales bacterium]